MPRKPRASAPVPAALTPVPAALTPVAVASPPRRLEYVPVEQLRRAPRNPKRHAEALAHSMSEHGYVAPIVWDERTQMIAAGHGRLEVILAARAAGAAPPEGVLVEGGQWLVGLYRGWASQSDDAAAHYLLADNQVGVAGGWDAAEHAAMLQELAGRGVALASAGYTAADVEAIVAGTLAAQGAGQPSAEGPGKPKRDWSRHGLTTPEEGKAEPLWVKDGGLYQVGRHRLLIGDATHAASLDRLFSDVRPSLVVGDPPYAVFGSSTGVGSDVADDKMIRPFFEAVFHQCYRLLPPFAHVYFCCDWRSWAALWEGARRASISAKNMIVWDKGGGLGASYMNAHELVFFGARLFEQRSGYLKRPAGQRAVHWLNVLHLPMPPPFTAEDFEELEAPVRSLLERLAQVSPPELVEYVLGLARDARGSPPGLQKYSRPRGEERAHNAAKPQALFEELIRNSSREGEVVWEPFAGGGTTFLACEALGRACYATEIEPLVAQRILVRLRETLNVEPRLLEAPPPPSNTPNGV